MLKEIIFLANIFHIVKKVIAIINDLSILSVGYIFTINSITQLDKCINVRTHTHSHSHTYIYTKIQCNSKQQFQ